jgi:hypothetical protein
MNYSSRFWLYAPITLFLLIAAAVMVHWWMVAGAFEKELASLKGREAVPGVTLDWDSVAVGGFPFRLDADFVNFRVTGAGAHGPFAWASGKFALHILTYGLPKAVYEAAGRQSLRWNGNQAISFLPGSMRGSSILDARGLRRFDLDIVDIGSPAFIAGRFQFHMRRDPDGADLDLMVKADTIKAKGAKLGNLQVYAALSQAKALAALLAGEMSWPQAAANWQAQGGKAKLSQVIVSGDLTPQLFLEPLY